MAKMTITYKGRMGRMGRMGKLNIEDIRSTIISCIKAYGEKYNITQMFNSCETHYISHNPVVDINFLEDGKIQISDVNGKQKNIKKTRSKLLKMVKGLELI